MSVNVAIGVQDFSTLIEKPLFLMWIKQPFEGMVG